MNGQLCFHLDNRKWVENVFGPRCSQFVMQLFGLPNTPGRIRVRETSRLRGEIFAVDARWSKLLPLVDPKNNLLASCDRNLCQKGHM